MRDLFLKFLRILSNFLSKLHHALDKHINKSHPPDKKLDSSIEDKTGLPVTIFEATAVAEKKAEETAAIPLKPPVPIIIQERYEVDYKTYLFGIDLGTSTTKISCYRKSGHNTIEIGKEGLRIQMPSLVCFRDNGIIVGEVAAQWEESLESRHIKLKLGRISELSDGEKERVSTTFCEIFKEVIRRTKEIEEFTLLDPRKMRLNISTSSSFDLEARELFLNSAKKAGFANLSLDNVVEEPVAAGLSYIETCGPVREPLYILVCDYGGGTFDCSLICVSTKKDGKKKIDVLATAGVLNCGGAAIDKALSEFLTIEFHLSEILKEQHNKWLFPFEVEEIKKQLSSENEVTRNISNLNQGKDKIISCNRDNLNKIIDKTGILERSFAAIEWVIRVGMNSCKPIVGDYEVFMSPIDTLIPSNIKILFAGGTSKIPHIKENIMQRLGVNEYKLITKNDFPRDPVEAVVIGDSYSRAFEGINLNRPPFKIILEKQGEVTQIQECFEGFLVYDDRSVNREFSRLAQKTKEFNFKGRIDCKIYICDYEDRRHKFVREHGANWDSKEEDSFYMHESNDSILEIVRRLNGSIEIWLVPYVGMRECKAMYVSPWRTDDDLSELSTWYPLNQNPRPPGDTGDPG